MTSFAKPSVVLSVCTELSWADLGCIRDILTSWDLQRFERNEDGKCLMIWEECRKDLKHFMALLKGVRCWQKDLVVRHPWYSQANVALHSSSPCPQSAELPACSPLPYGQRWYVHGRKDAILSLCQGGFTQELLGWQRQKPQLIKRVRFAHPVIAVTVMRMKQFKDIHVSGAILNNRGCAFQHVSR